MRNGLGGHQGLSITALGYGHLSSCAKVAGNSIKTTGANCGWPVLDFVGRGPVDTPCACCGQISVSTNG